MKHRTPFRTPFRTLFRLPKAALGLLLSAIAAQAGGQVIVEDALTGASSTYAWTALKGACLTAGDGTGSVPKCVGLPYYASSPLIGGVSGTLPDPVGQGALRLTNGDTSLINGASAKSRQQNGAVVSTNPFPATQGLKATFTTVTYGGNGYSSNGSYLNTGTGADGISFFLADGSRPASVGASGGSLGYSCSNVNEVYDGVLGGYLGVGIDEYGNFANKGDNTDTGSGAAAGRISLRGAGNTAFSELNALNATWYPNSLSADKRREAVQRTCRDGYLWNYSNAGAPVKTATALPPFYNYAYMAGVNLPAGITISNQQGLAAPKRGDATPISYGVDLTQNGLLSVTVSVNGGLPQTIINNQSITATNGPIPTSFRFGFSAGTGWGTNIHEIMCFKAAPNQTSSGSAALNQSSKVQIGTQVYLGSYNPTNWWGSVTAQNIVQDTTSGTISISSTANWDAGCGLTGGLCVATGTTATVQAPGSRAIVTWSPDQGKGIPFQWASLDTAQKAALTAGDATATDARLRYLRGDRSGEISAGGSFRTRTRVLGDVMNSSPTWVGFPQLPYAGPWKDLIHSAATAAEGTSYQGYRTSKATRTNVVYVGSNDGMLHGFRAGAYDASGNFNTAAANDGQELIAYMPAAVVSSIHSTDASFDYSSPRYSHNAYVDATVGTGDLYYNGAWHTWIAGGLGGGGNPAGVIGDRTSIGKGSFYVLDVTDPSAFSEASAASLVVTEINSDSTIACANYGGPGSCWTNLGNTYGTPLIRRLHDGSWAVIFGNGLNSSTGVAGIYIMAVANDGSRSFRFLSTGAGPSVDGGGAIVARNGIVNLTSADFDGDHIADYLYAGDVLGNLWRFDLTSNDPANWAVRGQPLFSTGGAPITTRPTVSAVPDDSGATRIMLGFGSGQILPRTMKSSAQPAAGPHSLYGVWDADMAAWNALGSEQYAAQAGVTTIAAGQLQVQTITEVADPTAVSEGMRVISRNPVCWTGGSGCGSNDQFGWRVALPGTDEQIIYNPTISDGVFVVNTAIPATEDILTCSSTRQTGYTMALDPDTGGALPKSYFQNYTSLHGGAVGGLKFSGVGTATFVSTGIGRYMVTQTVQGSAAGTPVMNPSGSGRRLTWSRMR